MLFLWFDHPLIEAWLERQLAAPRRDQTAAVGTSLHYGLQ